MLLGLYPAATHFVRGDGERTAVGKIVIRLGQQRPFDLLFGIVVVEQRGVSPLAYILGIVKKKCAMHLRDLKIHRKVRQSIYDFARWEMQHDIAPLEDYELNRRLFSEEVAAIFQARIESLPELTRNVYLSKRDENLSHQQIVLKFNITQRQVNREMHRALTSLRLALKDYLPAILIALYILRERH